MSILAVKAIIGIVPHFQYTIFYPECIAPIIVKGMILYFDGPVMQVFTIKQLDPIRCASLPTNGAGNKK
jgi:hypothetical protein